MTKGLEVRNLLRTATTASLATTMTDGEEPYCSLVLMATDMHTNPLLLLSDLAIHSQNMVKSTKVSLLISAPSEDEDPLTRPRISVQGAMAPVTDPALHNRFLRRYPSTADYASFSDFNFYRLSLKRVHLVAGFGKISWIDKQQVINRSLFLEEDAVEADILDHMNSDHTEAVQLLGGNGSRNWRMCGVDPEGADLRSGWNYRRILFDDSAKNTDDIRTQLIQLVKKARN